MSQIDPYVLVLYYSSHGTTNVLAYAIAQGIEDAGMTARIRTVPTVAAETTASKAAIPDEATCIVLWTISRTALDWP